MATPEHKKPSPRGHEIRNIPVLDLYDSCPHVDKMRGRNIVFSLYGIHTQFV